MSKVSEEPHDEPGPMVTQILDRPSSLAVEAIVDNLEGSSIEDVLRVQDQLQKLVRERYERALALMFTDIVESTRYFEQFGDAAGRRMIQRHNDLLIPIIEARQGRVVKTIGDAIMASFPSPALAVEAAVALQRALDEAHGDSAPEEDRIRIRIGINFGKALVNDRDGDLHGDMVNVAARVQAQAGPTQIFVSEAVKAALPRDFPLLPVGRVELKGKVEALPLYEVPWRRLSSQEQAERPRIAARYAILEQLGAGGMASVWRARDERLGRQVAVKVLHRHLPFSASMRERLQREAQVAAALTHENVVQVYDFSVEAGQDSFIAMELVAGRSLRTFGHEKGALPSLAVLLVAYEISRGLGYAHARGVIHRDVKPDNILLSTTGAVKVADFGIAVMDELVRLTATGAPVGTPAYLAPEQIKGGQATPQSDVFSLGVLLYELTTGGPPFLGKSTSAVLYSIVEGNYAPPEQLAPVDPDLSRLIKRCLAREPRDRFASGDEVAEWVRGLLREREVVDPRAVLARYVVEGELPEGRAPAPRLGRRWTWAAASVVAGLVTAAAVVAWPGPAGTQPPAVSERVEQAPGPEGPPASLPPQPPTQVAPPPVVAASTTRSPGSRPVRPARASRPPRRPEPAPAAVPAEPGTLELVVVGAWAAIKVDGEAMGKWPAVRRLSLPAGRHTLELSNVSFEPYRAEIVIEAGETLSHRVELVRASP